MSSAVATGLSQPDDQSHGLGITFSGFMENFVKIVRLTQRATWSRFIPGIGSEFHSWKPPAVREMFSPKSTTPIWSRLDFLFWLNWCAFSTLKNPTSIETTPRILILNDSPNFLYCSPFPYVLLVFLCTRYTLACDRCQVTTARDTYCSIPCQVYLLSRRFALSLTCVGY